MTYDEYKAKIEAIKQKVDQLPFGSELEQALNEWNSLEMEFYAKFGTSSSKEPNKLNPFRGLAEPWLPEEAKTHKVKHYVGFVEEYDYCEVCGAKGLDRGLSEPCQSNASPDMIKGSR
ncbi:MAG: hypothetical protein V4440_00635 [Pseudomonadota bacterium]